METIAPTADTPPEPEVEPPPPGRTVQRWPRIWFVTGPLVVAVLLMAAVSMAVKVPYVSFSPGSATPVQPLISVPKAKASNAEGKVLFLTVSVRDKIFVGEALADWLDPNADVLPRKEVYGNQTATQNLKQNQLDMDQSKHLAELVAFRKLGYEVKIDGTGAVVGGVAEKLPVTGKLHTGDVITAINGQKVAISDDVTRLVRLHKPGDTVVISVQRQGEGPTETVTTTLARNSSNGKPIIGLTDLQTRDVRYHFPFNVGIDSARVVGPSGGLAFTLGILDRLTPGKLTGNHIVAVTGEIAADGSVLPIGGVRQKVVAAEHQGADMMLVPSDDYADAKAKAGSKLKVYRADSLDQALAVLKAHGGDVRGVEVQPGKTAPTTVPAP